MMKSLHASWTSIIVFALFICLSSSATARSTDLVTNKGVLKIGLAGSAPFVISENNQYSGIAVEIWDFVARSAGWNYEFVPYESVHQGLDEMVAGKVDLLVGPVSITADRALRMRFSQPYYQSSLGILSRLDKPGIWDRIKPFFSFQLLVAVGAFLLILALVGTLIWFMEREKSPEQFPHDPAHGIANGMWLAIVTMTTTGYGDRAPVTFWGRIIAGAWMVISILFATSMVAGIASTLTLTGMGSETISRVEQLSGKKVATLKDSPAEGFLLENSVKAVVVEDIDEAYKKLKKKEVDAVVYDRPQLLYYLKKHKDKQVKVSSAEYDKQGYGFAFPLQTNINHSVNVMLLQLSEEHKIDRIIQYWLNTGD